MTARRAAHSARPASRTNQRIELDARRCSSLIRRRQRARNGGFGVACREDVLEGKKRQRNIGRKNGERKRRADRAPLPAFVDGVLLLTVVLGEVIAGVRMMRVRERLLLGRSRRGPLLEQRGDQRARGPAMTQPNRPAVRERCRHEADGHERAAQEADKGKTD